MFRLGCAGCLTLVLFLAGVGGAAWGVFQVVRTPEVAIVEGSPADGLRAQQKIFDLVRRAGSSRAHTTALSEPEVNAFLRRHLGGEEDLPLRQLGVRLLGQDRGEIVGQIPLRQLLALRPFSALTALMPESTLDRTVWLTLATRAAVETADQGRSRRRLRLDVTHLRVGRLPLPELMLRLLFDPSTLRLLRWSLPDGIDAVRIDPGRLVLTGGG